MPGCGLQPRVALAGNEHCLRMAPVAGVRQHTLAELYALDRL
jgi:hypothetical protein